MSDPRHIGIDPAKFAASLSAEDREIFERIDLGIDIEAFFANNPIGQFLARLIDSEREDAMTDLIKALDVDPDDKKTVMRHHRRIAMCDQFRSWLVDAIEAGRQAEEILKARTHSD